MSNPSSAGITDEQRLTWVAVKVQEWGALRKQAPTVMPGSGIAADDAVFPVLPISHLIWHGISHAIDHLDLFMYPLIETGTAFPPRALAVCMRPLRSDVTKYQ